MKQVHSVPAMRQERSRWFFIALPLLLSLSLSGCGFDFGFGQPTETNDTDAATRRIEAAADQAEAAANRAEAAAQRVETAAQQAEAAAQRVETASQRVETAAQQVETAAQQSETAADQVETAAETAALQMSAPPVSDDNFTETNTDTPEDEAEDGEADLTALERAFGQNDAADDAPINVGVITTQTGIYASAGEDALRGLDMALAEFRSQVNGRPIETIIETTNGDTANDALDAARRLIEEEDVDILLGPLSGADGLIIRDIAKNHPDKTFINGVAEAQDITLRNPAPNFFRFNMDGVQWMAGLGNYAYEEKDYRRVVALATDSSFRYGQVGGFVIGFCQAGGDVSETFWVPPETTDFSGIISVLPDDIDAIYLGLNSADSLNFLEQYQEASGAAPLIAGSITLDRSLLSAEGDVADYLLGTPAAGPIADNNPDPDWQRFVETYQEMFPDGFDSPSLFAHGYYLNTKAMMFALREVEGDLSDGQQAFQEALSDMSFDSPTGPVRLDENRQAISSNFITEMARDEDGNLYNEFIAEVPNVTQTLGLEQEAYLELGPLSRNNLVCEDIKALAAAESDTAETE